MSPADMSLLALLLISLGELLIIIKQRSTLKKWRKKIRLSDRIVKGAMRGARSEL